MNGRGAGGRADAAVLSRLGLSEATAARALRALGVWSDGGPEPDAWPVVNAVATGANPDRALQVVTRLAEHQPDRWAAVAPGAAPGAGGSRHPRPAELIARIAVVAGASESLGDLVATSPAALDVLDGELPPVDPEEVAAAARTVLDDPPGGDRGDTPAAALTAVQRHGLLQIAARDLLGLADTPQVAGELAALADAIVDAALAFVRDEVGDAPPVAVIGMGKLGGRELNYVSDIDLMFVHGADWTRATKVCERLLRLLGETTPLGRAYQVDANLRPEGRDGQLVRSLDAYRRYYERWAQPWEFQALLKARAVAGDRALGQQFVEAVAPFVWRDRLPPRFVDEVQAMKGTVEETRDVRRAGSRQVKLGPGGLRDIEFAVQLLQLVHGRHDPSLRSSNTLEALGALATGGYVGEDDAEAFGDAYRFLRTVEHRLQLVRLRRTHTIPSEDEDRGRLARATGFVDAENRTALEHFDAELRRVQGLVRHLHAKLFYRPLLGRFAELGPEAVLPFQQGPGEPALAEGAALERLNALGFANPDRALAHLDALASGVSRRARVLRTLLPAVLPTLAESPDPDGGLAAFRALADRLGASPFFLRTLRDTPPVGEVLAQVLGASRVVGEWLERQPEVFGQVADLPGLAHRLDPEDYRRQTEGLLRRGEPAADAANSLRRMRRRELARTAVRDLSGQAGVRDVAWELTGLAEACLEAATALAREGGPQLAVVGLGKLGARELAYASDLDVLLVCPAEDELDDARRAATRLLGLLGDITPEGQAFRVDVGLRPEGKDGPLVRTLDSYQAYYRRWADHWEIQALTQARPVAGDRDLGQAFVDAVAPLVFPEHPPPGRLQAVRRMKARIETERAGDRRRGGVRLRRPRGPLERAERPAAERPASGVGGRIDLKLGPGGLADIEWTAQLIQLRLGGSIPSLRVPGTSAMLEAAEAEGILAGDDGARLRDGLVLLQRARNAVYLAGHRDADRLPARPADQERIGRMLGYRGAQAFLDDLGRHMRRVRRTHERLFYAH